MSHFCLNKNEEFELVHRRSNIRPNLTLIRCCNMQLLRMQRLPAGLLRKNVLFCKDAITSSESGSRYVKKTDDKHIFLIPTDC